MIPALPSNRKRQPHARSWACVLLALAALQGGCKGNSTPTTPPPAEVSAIRIEPRPVTLYDEYVAQTEAPDTIEIRSQVTGLLERKAFNDGAHVAKGALLYVIDRRPFEAQLLQAQANLAQAQANLANAQDTLTRRQKLLAANFVSEQDYNNALAQQRGAAAAVQGQQAAVRTAQIDLDYTTIRAPREGYVSASLVKPGAVITAQQTLLTTLYSSDPMWVYFSISEDKMLELESKLKRPLSVQSDQAEQFQIHLPDGSDYKFPGHLDFVDAAVDEKTGTLQARISVPNPERILRPGLFVRVSVPAPRDGPAILVPQQAVQEQQGLKSVFVVDSSGKAQPKQIVAHERVEQDWLVESGLARGDTVVVEGVAKLRPGQQVEATILEQGAAPQASGSHIRPASSPATSPPAASAPTQG